MSTEQAREAGNGAAPRLLLDKTLDPSALADDAIFQQLDEMTSAATKVAKDYRSWMLENMKGNISSALKYADGLVSASRLPDFAASAAGQLGEQGKGEQGGKKGDASKPEQQLLAPTIVAEEYRTKMFELMTANVNATFEYAQRLAGVRSPAEFLELSSNHARKHLDLLMTHAVTLGALSQSLTKSNAERMAAGIASVLNRQKT